MAKNVSVVCLSAEILLAVFVGTAFCLGFSYMQKNASESTVMSRVNNKRKHMHQMRANVCFGTHFSTRVCAKVVCVFCMCVGHLSLTCTVFTFENEEQYWRMFILSVCSCNKGQK